MGTATNGRRDGRTVRAERTRQALVDALLALLYEGELQPTAERIAKRAGVSERSLFQHFTDREALYQAVAVQQYERVAPTLEPIDLTLPLAERIDAFVAQRARLLEEVTPVRRAALLLEPESEVVSGWLQSTRRQKAREVERVFRAELDAIEQPRRGVVQGALVAASAWTFWESLRAHQRLSAERSRAAMRQAVASLLGER
jgi:TetR/AcrR family transcriptional regulator, regulator of autoinduction and epiphytic fitness